MELKGRLTHIGQLKVDGENVTKGTADLIIMLACQRSRYLCRPGLTILIAGAGGHNKSLPPPIGAILLILEENYG